MNASIRRAAWAAAFALAFAGGTTHASSFTYQGSLDDGGQPANGRYDLRVTLYANAQAAVPSTAPVTLYGVEVSDGRFSAEIDFAGNIDSDARIGVAVRKAGEGDFVELAGRSGIAGSEACWSTAGNAGLADGSFIGTLDARTFVMRANNHFGAGIRSYDTGVTGVSFEVGNATASAARAAAFNWGLANAVDSFAGGYSGQVDAGHDRSFVWGGTNRVERLHSSGPDQFDVWADGGFMVNTSALYSPDDDVVIAPRGGSGADSDVDLRMLTRSGKYGLIYVNNETGVMNLVATGGVHIPNPVLIQDSLKVDGAASKATAGAWQANSDGRIKQDIETVDNALETLAKVRPVTFRYTDAYRADHPQVADQRYYNVIAQEFAEVFPDAVTPSGEYLPGTERTADNEILQVDTYPAQIVTIAAVQELTQRNAALEATVKKLMARVAALETAREK